MRLRKYPLANIAGENNKTLKSISNISLKINSDTVNDISLLWLADLEGGQLICLQFNIKIVDNLH